ncbi:uncharacterized protein LOC134261878 [Saccostrea cucullata]|uniref:uncharacterized protein LOC134261878 n=1 Tax=Saccostrea cuccullata TaxID=36930 RepID=UPI002ED34396
MYTDGYDDTVDREDRPVRMASKSEKGQEYYKEQKEMFEKRLKSSGFMLSSTIETYEQTLPKSITGLEMAQADLHTAYKRYDKDANSYLDFLARSRETEAQEDINAYWEIMNDLKKKYNSLMDKITLQRDSVETRSMTKSHKTDYSYRSQKSNASEAALKRAKAEAEKVKLKFAEQEVTLKKEQFDKTLQIELLQQRKTAAAADAEATYLEKQSTADDNEAVKLPEEELSPLEKTLQFLDEINTGTNDTQPPLTTDVPQDKPLSPDSEPFVPKSTLHEVSSTPQVPSHIVQKRHSDRMGVLETFDDEATVLNHLSPGNFVMKKNLLLETFQQQKFDDKPDVTLFGRNNLKSSPQTLSAHL